MLQVFLTYMCFTYIFIENIVLKLMNKILILLFLKQFL